MSVLGTAIRDNTDLHRAIWRIVGTLAAAHLARTVDGLNPAYVVHVELDSLCELAAAALPHLPPPEPSSGTQTGTPASEP